jgi:hypothetical protein
MTNLLVKKFIDLEAITDLIKVKSPKMVIKLPEEKESKTF